MANLFKKDEFASLLKQAMGTDRSINQYALHSTVSATYISKLLRGLVEIAPSPEVIRKLTDKAYNGISYEQLMIAAGHWSKAAYKGPLYSNDDLADTGLVQIPVLENITSPSNFLTSPQVIEFELVPKEFVVDGEYFFLRVTGDSMIDDGIREGFRVLVRHQERVEQGKIAVVFVDDTASLKRVYYQEGMVILQSSNRNIPPKVLPVDQVRILGQVTKVEFNV